MHHSKFARTMSLMGHERPSGAFGGMTGSLPTADIRQTSQNVSVVPQPDSCRAAKESYWITSSARAITIGGKSMPSAPAVLRLTTNSIFVGCPTGRSAGVGR